MTESTPLSDHDRELRAYRLTIDNLKAQLIEEARWMATEKLRADQMTKQHSMQCEMRKDLENQLAAIGAGGVEPLRKSACLRAIAEPVTAAPQAQLAGQGHELDRQAALQDSAYAAGMLSGWNLCVADDHATFSRVRGERMTGAARVANAAPTPAQADALDAALLDFIDSHSEGVIRLDAVPNYLHWGKHWEHKTARAAIAAAKGE